MPLSRSLQRQIREGRSSGYDERGRYDHRYVSKYGLDIWTWCIFRVYRKEVMVMKRFMVPRVAHCGEGH
jgi:hypothetical protein